MALLPELDILSCLNEVGRRECQHAFVGLQVGDGFGGWRHSLAAGRSPLLRLLPLLPERCPTSGINPVLVATIVFGGASVILAFLGRAIASLSFYLSYTCI
ncbi:MAG: hypothetical protein J7647_32220 [Cyanobacteria bacterium SBLK]|nr:hypothetical protein [Cyanobacteria bacterium SBLK]